MQARREAQEVIRADAKARWAKLGIVLRRMAIGIAVVLVVLVVLLLVKKVFDRAAMPGWLVIIYQVRDLLGAVVELGGAWRFTVGRLDGGGGVGRPGLHAGCGVVDPARP